MQVKDSIKEYEYKLERVVHIQGKLQNFQHVDDNFMMVTIFRYLVTNINSDFQTRLTRT